MFFHLSFARCSLWKDDDGRMEAARCCKVNLCCARVWVIPFLLGCLLLTSNLIRGEKWLKLETDQMSSAAVADFFLVLVKVGRFLLRCAL